MLIGQEIILGLVAIIFVLLIIMDVLRRRRVRHLIAKATGPPNLPFIGGGLKFLGDSSAVNETLQKLMKAYESPAVMWLGTQLFILIDNPEDLQIVLNSNKSLAKHKSYKFFKQTKDSLFSADVPIWKQNRRIINGLFTTKYLQSFLPAFNRNNQKFLENIYRFAGADKVFDIGPYFMGLSLNIICETAMGYDAKAIENPQECEYLNNINWINREDYLRIYKPWLHPDFMQKIFESKKTKRIREKVQEITDNVIRQRREFWKDYEKKKKDGLAEEVELNNFLDLLLQTVESKHLTDKYLREETFVMIIGGAETTALLNSFCSLMLAMHPDVQSRLQKEIDRVYDEAGSCTKVTEEMLTNFGYLEQVLMETLRRYCVAPVYLREPTEDLKLTSVTAPKGSAIAICAQAMHMNPKYYTNPEIFDPNRWTPEEVAKRHKYSFLAFSGGPRGCIGSKFGIRSSKVTMSKVVRHFQITTPWKMSDIKLKSELLLLSKNGYPVSIVPRRVCPCQKSLIC